MLWYQIDIDGNGLNYLYKKEVKTSDVRHEYQIQKLIFTNRKWKVKEHGVA